MGKTLAGDRGIEWDFVLSRLPEGTGWVLDFGPMPDAGLSVTAARRGYEVVACGLERLEVQLPEGVRYFRQDFLTVDLSSYQFDFILNASTTEHVGLTRYGDPRVEDGDLRAMAKMKTLLAPGGRHLLTVPVGQDAVIGEYHRVYGVKRLPRLLGGWQAMEEQYWVKAEDDSRWLQVDKARALAEIPGKLPVKNMLELSYGLGCFVLCL